MFLGITEYKQRLEASLKTEKAEHQKSKSNLENQLNEEKNKCDSDSNQSKMKFNSLQQHYHLLEVRHQSEYFIVLYVSSSYYFRQNLVITRKNVVKINNHNKKK